MFYNSLKYLNLGLAVMDAQTSGRDTRPVGVLVQGPAERNLWSSWLPNEGPVKSPMVSLLSERWFDDDLRPPESSSFSRESPKVKVTSAAPCPIPTPNSFRFAILGDPASHVPLAVMVGLPWCTKVRCPVRSRVRGSALLMGYCPLW